MNLKKETLAVLHENGKKKSDVRWVVGAQFAIPVELFWKLADEEYDSGYGAQMVAYDLIVVGDGFWLERREYDGSEWWEFKEAPPIPKETRSVDSVIGTRPDHWWSDLARINGICCE